MSPGGFDQLRKMFAGQFKRNGPDYLYRNRMRGEPVRVSKAERDALVAAYNRHFTVAIWCFFLGLGLAGVAVFLIWGAYAPNPPIFWPLMLTFPVPMIGFFVAHLWLWAAPKRLLARRAAAK